VAHGCGFLRYAHRERGWLRVRPGDPRGGDPYWSPDGSRIAYAREWFGQYGGPLAIASADGSNAVEFEHGSSGPWNPLP
jgi:hypothetical protein